MKNILVNFQQNNKDIEKQLKMNNLKFDNNI